MYALPSGWSSQAEKGTLFGWDARREGLSAGSLHIDLDLLLRYTYELRGHWRRIGESGEDGGEGRRARHLRFRLGSRSQGHDVLRVSQTEMPIHAKMSDIG